MDNAPSSPASTPNRIHPIVATAGVALILVSALGIAAMTGFLPSSHGTAASAPVAAVAPAPVAEVRTTAQNPAPVAHHSHPVHRQTESYSEQAPQYAQQTARPYQAQSAADEQPAARPTSGIGIAAGAIAGGLLGNQVGGGNGKTLATVAGAVAGGYVGNEVEKRTH